MSSRATAFVGLGGNLGDPLNAFRNAVDELQQHVEVCVTALSSTYRTSPVGYDDQPEFLNAVVRLETSLEPIELLDLLQGIESSLGRTRDGVRFGPRKIDLDLLLYGEKTIDQPRLTVPHPRLHLRQFALAPLAEIDGMVRIPGHGAVHEVLSKLLSASNSESDKVEPVQKQWTDPAADSSVVKSQIQRIQ